MTFEVTRKCVGGQIYGLGQKEQSGLHVSIGQIDIGYSIRDGGNCRLEDSLEIVTLLA